MDIEICITRSLTACQDTVFLKWILVLQLQISVFMSLYWWMGPGLSNINPTNNEKQEQWIGLILRRNCLLKHVTEGKIEVKL